jgi:hypothetical protein
MNIIIRRIIFEGAFSPVEKRTSVFLTDEYKPKNNTEYLSIGYGKQKMVDDRKNVVRDFNKSFFEAKKELVF